MCISMSSIFYQYYPDTSTSTNLLKCSGGNGNWTNTGTICASGDARSECNSGYVDAMCKNKDVSDKLSAITSTYNGEDERYANIMSKYNIEVLNAFNLGVGIIAGVFFIYKHRT